MTAPSATRRRTVLPVGAVARRRLQGLVLAATSLLAFSGAHALSLRLADPHTHLHEHGLAHRGLAHGQEQLAEFHSWQTPTALGALAVLIAALIALWLLPGPRHAPVLTGRLLSLAAAGSSAAFVLVETAEHAFATHTAPPAALLTIGGLVHAAAGMAAAALTRTVLQVTCLPRLDQLSPPAPVRRRAAVTTTPRQLHPKALLAVLTGRAPPRTTAAPQPSV